MKSHRILAAAIITVALTALGVALFYHPDMPSPPSTLSKSRRTPTPKAPPPAESEWTTYHGDSALRGASESALSPPLKVAWRWKTGAPVSQPPVVSRDRIFVVTERGDVSAADLEGKPIWTHELLTGEVKEKGPVRHRVDAPITVFDDRVLVGTMEGILFALDTADGKEKWRADLKGVIRGAANYRRPTGADDIPRVYGIEQPTGRLLCLDAVTGKELWGAEGVDRSDAHPSVAENIVAFGSCASALHLFDALTGKRLQNVPFGKDAQVAGGVAIYQSTIFSGSRGGHVFAVEKETGKIRWKCLLSKAEIFSTPAVSEPWVVVSNEDGWVFGIDYGTGESRWRYDTGGYVSSPVIAGDTVFVAVDGELTGLKLADGQKIWSIPLADEITIPVLLRHKVLVGSADGSVIALEPEKDSSPHE